MRNENGKEINDLTGVRSGKLIAIKYLYTIPHAGAMWECKCDCGNTTNVLSTHIKCNITKSCGCLARESFDLNKAKKIVNDLTGQKFGMLTVIGRAENQKRQIMWMCQCDCGSDPKSVFGGHLKAGRITSCGCTKSDRISEKLRKPVPEIYEDNGVCFFDMGDTKILFDKEDSDVVISHSWFFNAHGYVSTRQHKEKTQYLHRLVLGRTKNIEGYIVDHINGDTKDNRKINLRVATVRQNICNSGLRKDNSSGYKGVRLARSGRWVAGITSMGKSYYLGTFDTIDEAIEARKIAEISMHGEFVREEKYLCNKI